MDILNIEFPPRIALQLQRNVHWRTRVAETISGFKSADQQWSKTKHTYDASFAVRSATDYDVIVQHFHTCRGRRYGFPLRDPLDNRVEASRGTLPDAGAGYQLSKTYGTYTRAITRPKTGTVAIYRLRSGSTVDITGLVSISYTTGLVSMPTGTLIGGDVPSWSGQFYVPCMYGSDELPALVMNKKPRDEDGNDGELLVSCSSIAIEEVRQ